MVVQVILECIWSTIFQELWPPADLPSCGHPSEEVHAKVPLGEEGASMH